MLDVTIDGTAPEHVERIEPKMSVDESGKITWQAGLLDYNARARNRGDRVDSKDFNELFLKQVYSNNYISDSITKLFNVHLPSAIYRTFTSQFNLVPSYTRVFTSADWGARRADNYYYITIPASEHGFKVDDSETAVGKMNIDTEMYLLDSEGQFYQVNQVNVDTENTVELYTDDNSLIGFVVVRTNDKAYALAAASIDATQITGLAAVATSAKYEDLIDRTREDGTGPDDRITNNASEISRILSGEYTVPNAEYAETAKYAQALTDTSTIQNIAISSIFETGSSHVKRATLADRATNADLADEATHATEADNALYAITRDITDNSTYIATTAFVQAKVDSVINIKSGVPTIVSGSTYAKDSKLYRQVNFVYGYIKWEDYKIASGSTKTITVATLPEGFRPKTRVNAGYDISVAVAVTLAGAGTSPVCYINPTGAIVFDITAYNCDVDLRGVYFGFEIT